MAHKYQSTFTCPECGDRQPDQQPMSCRSCEWEQKLPRTPQALIGVRQEATPGMTMAGGLYQKTHGYLMSQDATGLWISKDGREFRRAACGHCDEPILRYCPKSTVQRARRVDLVCQWCEPAPRQVSPA